MILKTEGTPSNNKNARNVLMVLFIEIIFDQKSKLQPK